MKLAVSFAAVNKHGASDYSSEINITVDGGKLTIFVFVYFGTERLLVFARQTSVCRKSTLLSGRIKLWTRKSICNF